MEKQNQNGASVWMDELEIGCGLNLQNLSCKQNIYFSQ